MKKIAALLLLCCVAACTVSAPDCPREGGIGGTGGCPQEEVAS